MAPTLTVRFFRKQYAQNYGVVFTARMRDHWSSYTVVFYPTDVLAILGIIVATALVKPERWTFEPRDA